MARTHTSDTRGHVLGIRRPLVSVALAAAVMIGVAACGGGSDAAAPTATPAAPATAAAPAETVATTTPAPTATDAPTATVAPVVADITPELAAFAEANGRLVGDWSTQLTAFGEQAIDMIDDVSAAPAAAPVAELSDELVATIGPDTTDAGLITLRTFADGASIAIGYSENGQQDEALSVFLGLQAQSDALTAVLDQIDA